MNKNFPLSAIALALVLSGCNDFSNSSDAKASLPAFIDAPRSSVNINQDWKYQMNYSDIAAISPEFDDSGSEWGAINLPHSVDAENVINADPSNPHFKGMNTYRKTLTINNTAGKRQYIEFDGSAMKTTVFVNSELVGEHVGGFMRFRFDITDYIVKGENTIVLQVDNRTYDSTVHDAAFLPMETGQDFTYYGGIYRDVRLIEVGEVGLDAEDYGSSGVYFMQKNTTDMQSEIYSNIRVRNNSDEDFDGRVRTIIKDAEGKQVYSSVSITNVLANSVTVLESEFTLKDIHLWDGVKDPYLYRIFVEVFDGAELVDQIEQPLGLRYFTFDSEEGFLLNGEKYRLNGVAMHQDRDVVGWSTTKEMREGDLDLIREMGATSIRFSHYPHNIDTGEYSNQVGLMNYLELPIVNKYLTEGETGSQYLESAKEQMRALIRQNFNFPSMALVGNSNEVGMSMSDTLVNIKWLQELSYVIEDEFGARFGQIVPYRKSTMATVLMDEIGDKKWNTVQMPCHNRYYGWYVGNVDDVGGFIDDIKAAYPDLPFCMSEYGAGVSSLPEYATENPTMGDHSSQWGNIFHEGHVKAYNEREWVWGTYVWNMFDFSVATRNEGDTIGRNDKGLVKFDHVTKKDQFYFYQSDWSDVPMIHIVDTNLSEGSSKAVKVYSTLDAVTLSVNHVVVDTKKRSDNDPALAGVFLWNSEDIDAYFTEESDNIIQVSGTKNDQTFTDTFTKLVHQYNGSSIISDKFAVMDTATNGELTGIISHLPADITFDELKMIVTLDLGASWIDNSISGSIVSGDTVQVLAGNGDVRTYSVVETASLSTYRNAYSSLLYQFVNDDGAFDGEMFDGDMETTPIGIAFGSSVSVDLGAIYYVSHVEPLRNDAIKSESQNASYTLQIFGDIIAVDKVAHTEAAEWVEGMITLDGGSPAIKHLEISIPETEWFINSTSSGRSMPVVGFSEINVYGGLIKGDKLGLNYKLSTFTLDSSITDIDTLLESIVKIDSESTVTDEVVVELLDSSNVITSDFNSVAIIKVSQTRAGQVYTEAYSKL
ncbi:MAG: sugar-binding domain-containing protein [Psychromonas sp.]